MYAIVEDGGRQFKVETGRRLRIDYRGPLEAGTPLTFEKVLLVSDESAVKVGQPTVQGASVRAEVIGDIKGPKLEIGWFRRRKNSKKRTGHRQIYTLVMVNDIVSG
ncbi:MAG: 50S ribosomal protein L21 [Thermoguttaceae bacterium]